MIDSVFELFNFWLTDVLFHFYDPASWNTEQEGNPTIPFLVLQYWTTG